MFLNFHEVPLIKMYRPSSVMFDGTSLGRFHVGNVDIVAMGMMPKCGSRIFPFFKMTPRAWLNSAYRSFSASDRSCTDASRMVLGKVCLCGGDGVGAFVDFRMEFGVEAAFGVFVDFVLLFFLTGEWLGDCGSTPTSSDIDRFVMC